MRDGNQEWMPLEKSYLLIFFVRAKRNEDHLVFSEQSAERKIVCRPEELPRAIKDKKQSLKSLAEDRMNDSTVDVMLQQVVPL